ncbi:hypothetical protein NDU88_004125 [Pleurodeles waltl]|uniref:Uncharacterized protein n=1 Tax=Pleurodeles waltl TaxID=8319 RepID=A0AAV7T712_PLEWA|nr:hypothetical protein NDU88_004125 [Pleurodeles waltl]
MIAQVPESRSVVKFHHYITIPSVTDLAQKLEEKMYELYDHNNKLLQDKLQELPEILERINQLETELKQVCHTVVTVYKDLCVQPEL